MDSLATKGDGDVTALKRAAEAVFLEFCDCISDYLILFLRTHSVVIHHLWH